MKTLISTHSLSNLEAPLLVIVIAQGASAPIKEGSLERAIASGDYKGKKDETLLVYGGGKAQRILLVGVGKPAEVTRSSVRRAAAIAAKRARGLGTKAFALAVAPADKEEAEAGRRIGDAVAAGYLLTRNLQMQPGNVATPSYLAEQAKKLAAAHGFKVTILDKAQIKKEGMGALLAVAQGSAEEPRFIVMEYAGGSGAPVVLIGKGVTFDSGGISIKPALNMEDMKFDKSGATAVLGTFEALGRLKPKINVVGLIPATENLPSGTAIKPGDVVKSHLGKTIEIINTDAEGRLILCDALSYARRFKPAAA